MITLDQIRLLEQKVESAVKKITALEQEKEQLSTKCELLEKTNEELTKRYASLESDQERIEQGILRALNRLNDMENTVLSASSYVQADMPAKNPALPNQNTEEQKNSQNDQNNEMTAKMDPNNMAASSESQQNQPAETDDAPAFGFDKESENSASIPAEKPQPTDMQYNIF